MDILRFITAGSVDDGKSTLIGRLLYDSKSILVDQLEALEKQSKNKNADGIDLAILTDGLRAEREQGITIDVAYRYFSTPNRKFIIADAPGHVQYTRNMITGASNSQLIIILIDARQGVIEQTRRHSIIASLLKMKQLDPMIKTGLLYASRPVDPWLQLRVTDTDNLHPLWHYVDAAWASGTRPHGAKIFTWTINELRDWEHIKNMGVDGIMTDYPDRFVGKI